MSQDLTKGVDGTLEGCNSQESDTFGSLDQLAEAGQVSSQMHDISSQDLPFEVDAAGSQGQNPSQLSTEGSEQSAEESLQGNFPAVNIVAAGKSSPPNKKGGEASNDVARGKGNGLASAASSKGASKSKDLKDKGANDAKSDPTLPPGTSPEKGKKAAANGKDSKNAPPMEAEVDAADVLLSLSMSAARRSGRNPTDPVPPLQPGPPKKRSKTDCKDPAAASVAAAPTPPGTAPADATISGTTAPATSDAPATAAVAAPATTSVASTTATTTTPSPTEPASAKAPPAARTKKQATNMNYAAVTGLAAGQKNPKTKEHPGDQDQSKDKAEASSAKDKGPLPSPDPPPSPEPVMMDVLASPPPPPPAIPTVGGFSAIVMPQMAAPHPAQEMSNADKRSARQIKAEFVNPDEVGYVHKFRWEEQPEPAKKKPKTSSWVLPTKKTETREKLQTGGVKAGASPVKKAHHVAAHKLAQQRKHSGGSFSNVLGLGGGASQKAWSKPAAPDVPIMDEDNDRSLELEEQALKQQYETELGHDVQFGHLQIQTSNIKVSFAFEEGVVVPIDKLCEHLKKDEVFFTEHYKVRVKEKSAASNQEGRTFFGGVLTITMDVWDANFPDVDGHNTSVRLFGFREMDPERRHKAQFNGCSCKHGDTLPFFREVFGTYYKMADIRVEPNSVFSATDNAVMDPRYGLDMEALKLCLEKCQEDDIVQNFNLQVTGGVNFSFTALKGQPHERTCKPTVQKSGSIQLMLVDAPRRIRLETMRFLLEHCRTAFSPLVRLKLTKRTIDKRQKARRLVEQHRLREQTITQQRGRNTADKVFSAPGASHSPRLKEERDKASSSSSGGSAHKGPAAAAHARPDPLALGMSAALGLTALEHGLLSAAPPPPPPPDGAAVGEGGAGPAQHTPTSEQLKNFVMAASSLAAQPHGLVADPFTLALMPAFLSGAADPFFNLPGASAVGMTPFQFAAQTAEEKKGGEEDGLAQVSASLLV